MEMISNIPISELQLGMQAEYLRTITMADIELFARLSGDFNPLHLDPEYAKTTDFGGCIAHGAFCALLISAAVATKLPGPGSVYAGQEMAFKKPVRPGDELRVMLEVAVIKKRANLVLIDNRIFNQREELVFVGQSKVIAPTEKLSITPVALD